MKKSSVKKQLNIKIYMIREGFERTEDILHADRYAKTYAMSHKGMKGTLFLSQQKKKEIPFLDIYRPFMDELPRFYTGQVSAVFLCEAAERRFAVTHGAGWSWFKDGAIEQSFGLIAALNLLKPDRLKAVETATLDSNPLLTRQQSGRGGDAHAFRLDFFQDLLKSVKGESLMENPPVKLEGKDALQFQAALDLPEVVEYLPKFVKAFNRDELPQAFQWVNRIRPVGDKLLKDTLDGDLLGLIQAGDPRVFMAPPRVLTAEEDRGFKYPKSGDATHSFLCLEDYLNTLSVKARHDLTISKLTRERISKWSPESETYTPCWSIYKCLGAEVMRDQTCYVFHEGDWHEVSRNLYEKLEQDISRIPMVDLGLPAWDLTNKKNDKENAEKAYNERVGEHWGEKNAVVLDADNVYIRGNQRFEFCDVFHKDGTLLHVKRGRSSALLGHLINQSLVCGETLLDKTVRHKLQKKLKKKCPEVFQFEDPDLPVDPRQYHIVLAIAQEGDEPLNLPFFTKLNLRKAYQRLHMDLGYQFSLTKIQINRWNPTSFSNGSGPVRTVKPGQAA